MMAAFVITGEAMAVTARDLVLSDRPNNAWRLLADGLLGDDEGSKQRVEAVTRRVLEGTMMLKGDSQVGVTTADESDRDYQDQVRFIYAGRWQSPRGWIRPIAVLVAYGTAAGDFASRTTSDGGDAARLAWNKARASFYCGDDELPELVEVKPGSKFLHWLRKHAPGLGYRVGGHVDVIFERCGEPPFWNPPILSVEAALEDALNAGRRLRTRGDEESMTPSSFAETVIREHRLVDHEADRLRELAYEAEDEARARRLEQIATQVRDQAGDDVFDLALGDGRVVKVPRAPFVRWALRDSGLADHAPEWSPVSSPGVKMGNDDPDHTDWVLGAGLSIEEGYDRKLVLDAAYVECGRIQDRVRERPAFAGIMAALEGLRSEVHSAVVIRNAGPASGVVGTDVALLPDLSALQASKIMGCTSIICASGGPTSHLAVVSRLTIMLLRDATELLTPGQWVRLDPSTGKIHVGGDEDAD